jgi:hypothetical protein
VIDLADSVIEYLSEAIHATLWRTGAFLSGYAYATNKTGTRPTYNVWWSGFSPLASSEARAGSQRETTAFRFVIEIRVSLTSNPEASQKELMRLVQAAHNVIASDNRLGNAKGVLHTRLTGGSHQPDVETDNPMLVAALTLQVDYAGTWTVPN